MIAFFFSYGASSGVVCFRSMPVGDPRGVRAKLSVELRPRSRVSVIISDGSPRLTTLFGLAHMRCQTKGPSLHIKGSCNRVSNCALSSGNSVSFPMLNALRVSKVAGDRITSLIGRELVTRGLIGSPIIAMRFVGLCFSMLNRIGLPKGCDVAGSHVDLLRTVDVTNSLAVCNGHSTVFIVHRRGSRHIAR